MELRDARWPTRFAEAAIERLSDGAIKWTSFDSYSSITLFANKYRLAFEILVPFQECSSLSMLIGTRSRFASQCEYPTRHPPNPLTARVGRGPGPLCPHKQLRSIHTCLRVTRCWMYPHAGNRQCLCFCVGTLDFRPRLLTVLQVARPTRFLLTAVVPTSG